MRARRLTARLAGGRKRCRQQHQAVAHHTRAFKTHTMQQPHEQWPPMLTGFMQQQQQQQHQQQQQQPSLPPHLAQAFGTSQPSGPLVVVKPLVNPAAPLVAASAQTGGAATPALPALFQQLEARRAAAVAAAAPPQQPPAPVALPAAPAMPKAVPIALSVAPTPQQAAGLQPTVSHTQQQQQPTQQQQQQQPYAAPPAPAYAVTSEVQASRLLQLLRAGAAEALPPSPPAAAPAVAAPCTTRVEPSVQYDAYSPDEAPLTFSMPRAITWLRECVPEVCEHFNEVRTRGLAALSAAALSGGCHISD